MSSSVSTNQVPRETKSLTELFSDSSSTNSGPHRLSPVASTLTKTISVKQKERLIRKLMYPRLAAKMEKAGFAYQLSMEEIGYTQLEENAVTRTSTITTVVREMRKGIEYLVWYSIEKGYDKNGNEVIGSGTFLQLGLDKDVEIKSMRNSEGEVIKLQLSNITRDILTEEFSSDKLEQLLSKKSMRHESLTQPLGYKGGFGPVVFEALVRCMHYVH